LVIGVTWGVELGKERGADYVFLREFCSTANRQYGRLLGWEVLNSFHSAMERPPDPPSKNMPILHIIPASYVFFPSLVSSVLPTFTAHNVGSSICFQMEKMWPIFGDRQLVQIEVRTEYLGRFFEFHYCFLEVFWLDWLWDIIIHADFNTTLSVPFHGICRHGNDRNVMISNA